MRAIIERVTCDRCGQVFDFQKFDEGARLYRLEHLTEWLLKLGWKFSDGVKKSDICPTCVQAKN